MKRAAPLLLFALSTLLPHTSANIEFTMDAMHIEYDCSQGSNGPDNVACQQMCWAFYCMGKSNCLDRNPGNRQERSDARTNNHGLCGANKRPFNDGNIGKYRTLRLSPSNTCPDEFPWASSKQGGPNAVLMGHGVQYFTQAGMITNSWNTAERNGYQRICLEPVNWDPELAPACNCKPNLVGHNQHNPYGDRCQCDNDPMRKYQFVVTGYDSSGDPKFSPVQPDSNWSKSSWNYQGNPGGTNKKQRSNPEDAPLPGEEQTKANPPVSPPVAHGRRISDVVH